MLPTAPLAAWRAELLDIARTLADPPAAAAPALAQLRARVAEQEIALRQSLDLIWHLEAARLEARPVAGPASTDATLDAELAVLRAGLSRKTPAGTPETDPRREDDAARREALLALAQRTSDVRRRLDSLNSQMAAETRRIRIPLLRSRKRPRTATARG